MLIVLSYRGLLPLLARIVVCRISRLSSGTLVSVEDGSELAMLSCVGSSFAVLDSERLEWVCNEARSNLLHGCPF